MNRSKEPKTYTYRIENKQLWRELHKEKGKKTLDEAITEAIKDWVKKKRSEQKR